MCREVEEKVVKEKMGGLFVMFGKLIGCVLFIILFVFGGNEKIEETTVASDKFA